MIFLLILMAAACSTAAMQAPFARLESHTCCPNGFKAVYFKESVESETLKEFYDHLDGAIAEDLDTFDRYFSTAEETAGCDDEQDAVEISPDTLQILMVQVASSGDQGRAAVGHIAQKIRAQRINLVNNPVFITQKDFAHRLLPYLMYNGSPRGYRRPTIIGNRVVHLDLCPGCIHKAKKVTLRYDTAAFKKLLK